MGLTEGEAAGIRHAMSDPSLLSHQAPLGTWVRIGPLDPLPLVRDDKWVRKLKSLILSSLIRRNRSIQGITFGKAEIKVAQFADDLTCVLADEKSLTALMNTMQKFEGWSGLKINKRKTQIISPSRSSQGESALQGMGITDRAKILGVWLGLDQTEECCYEWNFKGILEKVQRTCDSWYQRSLSLKGKVTVANSLLISLLQYPCSIIHTPPRVFVEYKRIISRFIWNNRKPRISHKALTQPIERGGIRLFDLEARTKASLLQWIKRLLTRQNTNTIHSLSFFLETDDLARFLSYRTPSIPSAMKQHRFYYSMLKAYSTVHNIEPIDEDTIRREILWFNPQVGTQKKTLHWPVWERAGISTMGAICHPTESRLLSHIEIAQKFNTKCTFLEAISIRLQIPLYWRDALSDNWKPPPLQRPIPDISLSFQEGFPKALVFLSAKEMYNNLLGQDYQINAAYRKWSAGEDGIAVDNAQEWNGICARAFSSSRETKHQSFQFKLINRIIPCGVHLKHLRIRDGNECHLCQETDTIAHFFFFCRKVSTFWKEVCRWFRNTANLYLDQVTPKEFLFGLPADAHKSRTINFILIRVRFYIFRQKLFHDSELSCIQWLQEFKSALRVEEWICSRMGRKARFAGWKTF